MMSRKIAVLGTLGCAMLGCTALAGCNTYNGPLRGGAILPPQSSEVGVSPYFTQPTRPATTSTNTTTSTSTSTH